MKKAGDDKATGRDYKAEYAAFGGTRKAKKKRAKNNKARRKMIREGRARLGDGKDVAHKDNNTSNNDLSNLTLQSKKANRSFKRTASSGRKK